MNRSVLFIFLLAFVVTATACRPEACLEIEPHLQSVSENLDAEQWTAAIDGLAALEAILLDESGFLLGFGEISQSLRIALEARQSPESKTAKEADFAERRLPVLLEGWQREAGTVARRCRTTYLL